MRWYHYAACNKKVTKMTMVNTFMLKVFRRISKYFHNSWNGYIDRNNCTYSSYSAHNNNINFRLRNLAIQNSNGLSDAFEYAVKHFINHKFDLLGSGWVQVRHGLIPNGIEKTTFPTYNQVKADQNGNWLENYINPSNVSKSTDIWNNIKIPYTPIDWQLDFKSGYRWKQDSLSISIKPLGPLGSDIKVPWELARMQHLPQMALYFLIHNNSDSNIDKDLLLKEVRNQILDFIATNPPRYGVNWVCTMDVAIRATNWLVAYDLITNTNAELDSAFQEIFINSIYEHGKHIVENLEWTTIARGNHYLANIVGLIFISSYLPDNEEFTTWLAFSIQEFIAEVSRQFHTDGCNFEASTSYHRLSTQMIIYGAALLSNLPLSKQNSLSKINPKHWSHKPNLKLSSIEFYKFGNFEQRTPLPDWLYKRIESAMKFTNDITKPNGLVPMIGDNDSGYFLKIFPNYYLISHNEWFIKYKQAPFFKETNELFIVDEEQRNHEHIIHETSGLFGQSFTQDKKYETLIVSSLAGHKICDGIYRPNQNNKESDFYGDDEKWFELNKAINSKGHYINVYKILISQNVSTINMSLLSYKSMGIYIFKTKDFFLLVRCGEIGQEGIGGHAHNDQLSFELNYAGIDIITDPGTYLYTPFPELRNIYRSVKSHFSPQINKEEPADLNSGLFILKNTVPGTCLYFGKKGFIGTYEGYSNSIYRKIEICDDHILITDSSKNKNLSLIKYDPPLTACRYGMQLQSSQKNILDKYLKHLNS